MTAVGVQAWSSTATASPLRSSKAFHLTTCGLLSLRLPSNFRRLISHLTLQTANRFDYRNETIPQFHHATPAASRFSQRGIALVDLLPNFSHSYAQPFYMSFQRRTKLSHDFA